MKKNMLNILTWIMSAATLLFMIYFFKLRFQNPDMTDFRMMITFWKSNLIGFIVIIITYILWIWKVNRD